MGASVAPLQEWRFGRRCGERCCCCRYCCSCCSCSCSCCCCCCCYASPRAQSDYLVRGAGALYCHSQTLCAPGIASQVANMLPGPLISVASDLSARVRPGGSLLISGFKRDDLGGLRDAFEPCFELPSEPTLESEEGWIALACRRTDAALPTASLSESAVA